LKRGSDWEQEKKGRNRGGCCKALRVAMRRFTLPKVFPPSKIAAKRTKVGDRQGKTNCSKRPSRKKRLFPEKCQTSKENGLRFMTRNSCSQPKEKIELSNLRSTFCPEGVKTMMVVQRGKILRKGENLFPGGEISFT